MQTGAATVQNHQQYTSEMVPFEVGTGTCLSHKDLLLNSLASFKNVFCDSAALFDCYTYCNSSFIQKILSESAAE